MTRTGMAGFAEDGELPTAVGSVFGVRWFRVMPRHLPGQPPTFTPLYGAMGTWHPGENQAVCKAYPATIHTITTIPDPGCGCGFWAYWDVEASFPAGADYWHVLGVIEGYGVTRIGTKGFRCQKARIVGLHLTDSPPLRISSWDRLIWGAWSKDEETTREEIENQLADHYQVPVYATAPMLLARHPPTTGYARSSPPPPLTPVQRILAQAAVTAPWPGHQLLADLRKRLDHVQGQGLTGQEALDILLGKKDPPGDD